MRMQLWPDCPIEEHQLETRSTIDGAKDINAFVAVRGRAVALAGFIEIRLRPYADGCTTSPVGFIEGWYVDTDMRRRGIGSGLVAAAEEWARSRGCIEMASDTALDNFGSQAAHAELGYTEVERVIRYRKSLT
jgi:aminoglycoside 6'-N-acetyltransferase I